MNTKTEWQPIETAPKDGETLLLALEYLYVLPAEWKEYYPGKWAWCRSATFDPLVGRITHWMPLPSPPEVP